MGDLNPAVRKKKLLRKTGLPRHVKDMSKEQLEATLRKKRECNAKALVIVEQMIERGIDEEWFLEELKFIDAGHFQDINEERALCKICGYPLCTENLKTIPSQQYRISTRYNKVYDITERKNFCSNECYKANKFVKDQLITIPLWLRDKAAIPKFGLLPLGSKGSGAGEEVDLGLNDELKSEVKKLHKEEKFMSVADYTQDSIKELSRRVDNIILKEKIESNSEDNAGSPRANEMNDISNKTKQESVHEGKEEENNIRMTGAKMPREGSETNKQINLQVLHDSSLVNQVKKPSKSFASETKNSICNKEIKEVTKSNSVDSLICDLDSGSSSSSNKNDGQREDKIIKNTKEEKNSKQKVGKVPVNEYPEVTSSVIHIEKCLYEWFTIDSMCYLLGEEKVKDLVSDKGDCIKEYYKAVGKSIWDPVTQERYEALCRKLKLMEIQEELEEQEERELKPLPDYNILKEESLKMNFKIQAFYEGKLDYGIPKNVKSDPKSESTPSCVLPLVDLHAQNALRRRILLDNLKRVLPDLLRTFGLTSRDISTDVRNLITTFTLSAHNITFKPMEWNLLGLIIIKMLSIRDIRLKMLLETQQGTKYQTMLLMAFQQDGGYLDRLMYWLTDLDNIMKKNM